MLKNRKLGDRFTILLLIVFSSGTGISGVALAHVLQTRTEQNIVVRAEILTQSMNAVRDYTSRNIEPLLQEQANTSPEFIRETIPPFAAKAVFDIFRDRPEYRNFFYKEATLNPTNPQDRADEFEDRIVRQFRAQTNLKELSGYRSIAGKKLFYIARPLAVDNKSCLCHNTSATAPSSLVATYGTEGGYGWKMNEIVSAQTIYVSAGELMTQTQRWFGLIMGIFVAIFAVATSLINIFIATHSDSSHYTTY